MWMGMAVASMVCGIIGLIFSCVVIGVAPCLIGLILGIFALINSGDSSGMAISGIITSVIGIAVFIMTRVVLYLICF